MRGRLHRSGTCWARRLARLAVGTALAAAHIAQPALAENMDGSGGIYVWSENAGWINVQPGGPGGYGMQVNDFNLTGWLWGENVGWVSLSCRNTSSCGAVSYGVTSTGSGALGGYAWSENAGWIDFGPATAGVTISPATGVFDGFAWAENLGWISFGSTTLANAAAPDDLLVPATAFHIVTQWRCVPPPPAPSGFPALAIAKAGGFATLAWTTVAGATGYDVVSGDLGILRATGSFQLSTQQCSASHTVDTSFSDGSALGPGSGRWFLVRGANCAGAGTYNDGTQVGSRDPGIQASAQHCP